MARMFRNLLTITLPSLLAFALVLELIARWFLPVSDVPDVLFDPKLGNHFVPDQSGTFVQGLRSEISADFRINSDGWNAPHEYTHGKDPGTVRIAVIGDSYVEGMHVGHDRTFPFVAADLLNRRCAGGNFQSYSFGHSGANLAQYLNVLRYAVAFQPDVAIISVTHNDFQDALYGFGRKDNLTLEKGENGWLEVLPRPSSNLSWRRLARKSALARYAVINLELPKKWHFLYRLVYGDTRHYESNVDTTATLLKDGKLLGEMLAYLAGEFRRLADESGIDLRFMIDGNRQAIYEGQDLRHTPTHAFNKALQLAGSAASIPVIDLTGPFSEHWKLHGTAFNFEIDYHWNRDGHRLVAGVVADALAQYCQGES